MPVEIKFPKDDKDAAAAEPLIITLADRGRPLRMEITPEEHAKQLADEAMHAEWEEQIKKRERRDRWWNGFAACLIACAAGLVVVDGIANDRIRMWWYQVKTGPVVTVAPRVLQQAFKLRRSRCVP